MLTLLFLACQVSSSSEAPAPAPAAAPPANAVTPAPASAPAPQDAMPPLSPSEPFLAWLAQQQGPVILPVRVELNPLGIQGAALIAEPPVSLSLDTGAMGIPLDTRLQDFCPDQGQCAVWLKGRYGPLLGGGLEPAGHSFTVYEVVRAVDGTPTQARLE